MVAILENWVECSAGFTRKSEEILTLQQKIKRELDMSMRDGLAIINHCFESEPIRFEATDRPGNSAMFPDEMLLNTTPQQERYIGNLPPEPAGWGDRESQAYRDYYDYIFEPPPATNQDFYRDHYGPSPLYMIIPDTL